MHATNKLCLVFIQIFMLIMITSLLYGCSQLQRPDPDPIAKKEKELFINNPKNKDENIVIFLHGFRGNYISTWGDLATLLEKDKNTKECDFLFLGYPSGFFKNLKIESIANFLETRIKVLNKSYKNIILIGHSMGGLVIRSYILETLLKGKGNNLEKIKQIILLGTPNCGLENSLWLKLFPDDHPVNQMKIFSDYLSRLNNYWEHNVKTDRISAHQRKIKTIAVFGMEDSIVNEQSVRCDNKFDEFDSIHGDHESMVKIHDKNSLAYKLILKELQNNNLIINSQKFEEYSPECFNSFDEAFSHVSHVLSAKSKKILQSPPRIVVARSNNTDINLAGDLRFIMKDQGEYFILVASDEDVPILLKANDQYKLGFYERSHTVKLKPPDYVLIVDIKLKRKNYYRIQCSIYPRKEIESINGSIYYHGDAIQNFTASADVHEKTTGFEIPQKTSMILIPAKSYKIPQKLKRWFYLPSPDINTISIEKSFYIMNCEVTVREFSIFFSEKELSYDEKRDWQINLEKHLEDYPVTDITWNEAVAYAKWLSKKEGITYTLPDYNQWIAACIETKANPEEANIKKRNESIYLKNNNNCQSMNFLLGNVMEWSSNECKKGYHLTLGEDIKVSKEETIDVRDPNSFYPCYRNTGYIRYGGFRLITSME